MEFKFQTNKMITAHFVIGIIVLNNIVLQHIIGFIIKKAIESKRLSFMSSKIHQIKKIHKVMGYSIYFLTKASVLTGIWIYDYIQLL